MWVRNLYGMSLAEFVNATLLTGTGLNGNPRGILNTPGVTVRIAGTVGGNGDTLEPEDVASIVTDCQEVNGTFEGWIFRPAMTGVIRNRRSDAVVAGDKKGLWLFVEGIGANPPSLQGYPIWESTKVPQNISKGNASNLTAIIAGMLSQVYYGRMATMELKSSDQAGTSFQANQTWIRAIVRHDIQVGIPGTIVVVTTLRLA
jgi:HK97 family phage major capsid protein